MRRVINITFCLNQREQRLLALGNVEPDAQGFKRLLLREAARNVRLDVQMTLDLFEQSVSDTDQAVAPSDTTPPKQAKPAKRATEERMARLAITPAEHQHVDHTRFWSPSNPCGEPSCAHCNPPVVA